MTTNNPNSTNKARKLTGPDVLYPELSYHVMEAFFEVHNRLGPGFTEEIYQHALMSELEVRDISFESQKNIITLNGEKPMGTYRLEKDLLCRNILLP